MGGAGQKRGMGGGGGGGETKRKERRGVQTCVIRAENGRTRQLLEKKKRSTATLSVHERLILPLC